MCFRLFQTFWTIWYLQVILEDWSWKLLGDLWGSLDLLLAPLAAIKRLRYLLHSSWEQIYLRVEQFQTLRGQRRCLRTSEEARTWKRCLLQPPHSSQSSRWLSQIRHCIRRRSGIWRMLKRCLGCWLVSRSPLEVRINLKAKLIDLGIAIDPAVKVASELNVDNRTCIASAELPLRWNYW